MSLEQRYARQNLLTFYNVLNKNIKVELDGIMEIIGNAKTRGNTLKIRPKYARFRVRRNTYFHRIWKYWNEYQIKR